VTSWRGRVVSALPLAPLLGIAAYAVVLAWHLRSYVQDTATSDSVGPMVIAQSLPARSGSTVVMGNAAHYTWLWFDELTRHLPGYRVLWQAMPYALSLLGLLLLAWTVRRLAGPRAALITLAIGIATPPLVLVPLLSQAFHNTTFVNGIVLGWLLVFMATASDMRSRRVIAVAAVVALVTGLDVASDPLLLLAGVAPLVAAPLLLALRRRGQQPTVEVALLAGGVAAAAVLVAVVAAVLMHVAGYRVEGLSTNLAAPRQIGDNASLLGHLVLDMGNGRLALHDLGDLGPLRLLCGVLVLAAVAAAFWLLGRTLWTGRGGVDDEHSPGDNATALFLTYWGLVLVFVAIAFLITTLPVDRNSMRYLVPVFYAVAATVPFAVRRNLAAGVAVAFVGITGAVLLAWATPDDFNVQPQHADGLVAVLEAHDLHRGYAGYWQANLLTWESDGRVLSRAVQQGPACNAKLPGWFCPYPIFSISDWYAPQPGDQRTFLIREVGGSFVPDPPPSQPRPVEVFSYDRFAVYVYDHDVGADAARASTGWNQASTP